MSVKHVMYVKKIVSNPATCRYENRLYLTSIMDDSAIICDEVIESYDQKQKLFQQVLMKRKQSLKCILLAILLVTITLLITVSIYYYSIKYRAKQKHILSFHNTNNELEEAFY